MKRTDHIFAYYDPSSNKRYCRICSASYIAGNNICMDCVKQHDYSYICCSYSSSTDGKWTERFHFNNNIHKILVSTNGCNLLSGCNEECNLRNNLKNLYKQMENVTEK